MSASTLRTGGWIQTYTLRQFWPLDPRPEEVCIEDIAHALSNQCRFSGHLSVFYSVAQHCVEVSLFAQQEMANRGAAPVKVLIAAQWGLLHDASEAYLVDVPRPVKHLPEMAPYRVAEARLQGVICASFGLVHHEPDVVRVADRRLCATEARDLFPGLHPAWEQPAVPLRKRIRPWTPQVAEARFLERFAELWLAGVP